MNMKCLKINYPKDKTYLVAVSGGPDSMALLNMLYSLKYTIPDLIKKGQTIHPDSVNLYNELVSSEKG